MPALLLKHLNDRSVPVVCISEPEAVCRSLERMRSAAMALPPSVSTSITQPSYGGCPHSPHVCGMAFSLIWSESHLMALQQLCILTDAE